MDEVSPSRIARSLCLPFNRVPFVSQSEINNPIKPQKNLNNNSGKFDGVEVSKFYDKLVAGPSSVQQRREKPVKLTSKPVKQEKALFDEPQKCFDNNQDQLIRMIHRYAQDGNLTELKKCVESKINLDVEDTYGWTPLMCATSANQICAVKYLIKNGANINIQTPQGHTALDIAKMQNTLEEIQQLLTSPLHLKIKAEVTEKNISNVKIKQFCPICKKRFEDSVESHKRSIAHMLSSNNRSKKERTFYHIPVNNKGFQLMVKKGWDANSGLGPNRDGRKYPIKTVLKTDRSCLGKDKNNKERITHFGPNDVSAIKVKSQKLNPVIERETTLKKREREKLDRKCRQKEIAFRRSFNIDL